ncbi:23S rRNA (pseudouridine(1915)-N(3))-methyltransferase RlmH [uncultured Nitrosomonas sp.]|uniref:23S rRNA (pseudouridine(1915)-N(3))-methyltransferase RlmH n=1 Tax=uncultured Nitrosomonas sp. TaxID=156424 RepID=UPI0025EAA74D|nr:23S rRNA (pseudouridine(1915)-N(3))-methyltransferase RlmH [uncultured Nitrosomonas sp.]
MKCFILAVGHKMPDWVNTGYLEYIKRIPREISVNLIEIKPEKRAVGKPIEQLLWAEYQRIRAVLPHHCRVKVLDEGGQQWTTKRFANEMQGWMNNGDAIAFVIGGADGLHSDIKHTTNELIAVSEFTLPHGLVRVVLAEQLYRAISILKNHPYHRD